VNLFTVIDRLHELQRAPRLKLFASIAIVALGVLSFSGLVLLANDPGVGETLRDRAMEHARDRAISGAAVDQGPVQLARQGIDAAILMLGSGSEENRWTQEHLTLGFVFTIALAVGVFIVQLGLGLSFLGVLTIGWGLASLLMFVPALAGIGRLIFAAVPLTLLFLTGVQLLRALLSWSHPVASIARNLVNEAIRMKISVVFIVLLILLLAIVPSALDAEQPLRYRVQQWLQYGVGFSYAIMALLTLFLAVGSVTTEQRDRVIWQTMSKPTAPWHYILGKWIGIMGINAVLLSVTAGGVYMFAEYLRRLPADGEVVYLVPSDRGITETEDRRILESQVLVARVGEKAQPYAPTLERTELIVHEMIKQRQETDSSVADTLALRKELRDEVNDGYNDSIESLVGQRFDEMQQRDPRLSLDSRNLTKIRAEIVSELEMQFKTIEPGQYKRYFFVGLDDVAQHGGEVALIYKVNSGSNDPAAMYSLSLLINGVPWPVTDGDGRSLPDQRRGLRQVSLGSAQTLGIPMRFDGQDTNFIDERGVMELTVVNGHPSRPMNPQSLTFPPDGLEILYPVGSYTVNFVRIMVVIWIKLGFVASVALMAATFLSFPVACLVSLAVLFAAESSVFLADSLQNYAIKDAKGEINIKSLVIQLIAAPVAKIFQTYSELRPTSNLVDGRLVGWGMLFKAVSVIGVWTLAMLGAGWLLFRNRELALYSGK
jgi:ABC-type transport system involved in multi-copper enzyme maturation permease subunit